MFFCVSVFFFVSLHINLLNLNKESNMDDFRKYATKHLGMNSLVLDDVIKSQAGYLNPYILEERQLNVTQLDVFSRLMMDRIIFLGTQVDDYTANTLQAQLLYLDSVDPGKDISIYINYFTTMDFDIIKSEEKAFRNRAEFRICEKDEAGNEVLSYAMNDFNKNILQIESCQIVSSHIQKIMPKLLAILLVHDVISKQTFCC